MQEIIYGLYDTALGQIVIAKSDKGLCWLGFMKGQDEGAYKGDGLTRLQKFCTVHFPDRDLRRDDRAMADLMAQIMQAWETGREKEITLDLRGTDFQCAVWQALLGISKGHLKTYRDVANDIGKPKAMRAVGSAVGENPVSLIVPCHRVVPMSGGVGNYGWGTELKTRLLKQEAAPLKTA